MAKKRYRDFPVLDEKGRFIGFISRRRLLGARKKKVILVDHNERSQSIDGISDAEILEIIDHHRIGSVETVEPVFFRNQPVGSTSTIVAQMYKENDVEISKTMAALMCSAIISDTLLFRSPTCTPADRRTCEELAGIAGINMEELARSMFNAGSDLSGKTAEEICAMDFKQFVCGDMTFGVGQISSMDREELDEIKGKLEPAMNELMKEKELNMLFFMLTDVMEESSDILWAGPGARELIAEAFGAGDGENFRLDGVVSRKKQMVPAIMGALRR